MTDPLPAFEMAVAVEPGDIDALGHVNNVTYLRWVQDVAVAHWTAFDSAAAVGLAFAFLCGELAKSSFCTQRISVFFALPCKRLPLTTSGRK